MVPVRYAIQFPFFQTSNLRKQIETTLSPIELLNALQKVENVMGRVKVIDKGPRNIDLDILLHGNEKSSSERLTIPHALMFEREFVLRPLVE